MKREEVQRRLDEMYPRGATVVFFDDDSPEAIDNALYHAPRLLVTDVQEDTYTLMFDSIETEHIHEMGIKGDEEYGDYDNLTSRIFTTVDGDSLWVTSHVTDAMNTLLREYERGQFWFEDSQRETA